MSGARLVTDLSQAALLALGTSPAGPVFRHMVSLGAKVETAAKVNASGPVVGVRTGNLRSSIAAVPAEVRGGTRLVVAVVATASYATAVHEGTRPHVIQAQPGRVLAWQGPDGPGFATRVQHPGTKARPFLRDALPAINR